MPKDLHPKRHLARLHSSSHSNTIDSPATRSQSCSRALPSFLLETATLPQTSNCSRRSARLQNKTSTASVLKEPPMKQGTGSQRGTTHLQGHSKWNLVSEWNFGNSISDTNLYVCFLQKHAAVPSPNIDSLPCSFPGEQINISPTRPKYKSLPISPSTIQSASYKLVGIHQPLCHRQRTLRSD